MNGRTLTAPILNIEKKAPTVSPKEDRPALSDVVQALNAYEENAKPLGQPSGIPCPMCLKEGIESELSHTHTNTLEMSSEWWMTQYYGCNTCNRRYKSERSVLHGMRRNEEPEGMSVKGKR